jgi:hypothetical protein
LLVAGRFKLRTISRCAIRRQARSSGSRQRRPVPSSTTPLKPQRKHFRIGRSCRTRNEKTSAERSRRKSANKLVDEEQFGPALPTSATANSTTRSPGPTTIRMDLAARFSRRIFTRRGISHFSWNADLPGSINTELSSPTLHSAGSRDQASAWSSVRKDCSRTRTCRPSSREYRPSFRTKVDLRPVVSFGRSKETMSLIGP